MPNAITAVKARSRGSSTREFGCVWKQEGAHRRRRPASENEGAQRAEKHEESALDEALAYEPSARRSKREPYGDLARARQTAQQEKIRDVRAGDQQHEKRNHPHPHRDFGVVARRRAACGDDRTQHGA